MTPRLAVMKTYKLYVGGAFVRSESGRSEVAADGSGQRIAGAPRGSRKDVRDAVKAAAGAQAGWRAKTAYNRGQILYRFAEALESRASELAAAGVTQRGLDVRTGREEIATAIDVLVHHAGWADKLDAVMGSVNPVAAPFLSFTSPEPTGIVAVLAPDEPDVLGLVREIAPALAAGNTVVAIVSRRWPLRALDLGEVADVSDVPGGVLNLLAGRLDELLEPLCGHRAVNAIVDATGIAETAVRVDELAAETIKRVSRPDAADGAAEASAGSLTRLEALVELKTAWHPVGS